MELGSKLICFLGGQVLLNFYWGISAYPNGDDSIAMTAMPV